MTPDDEDSRSPAPVSRRDFIRITSVAATTTIAPSLVSAAGTAEGARGKALPVADVAKLSALRQDTPVAFAYPDENSPALLVRLGRQARGGIGPGQSIVAFSMLCTHKGCPVSYKPERKLLICPCHWSSFDPAQAGQMVIGQGSQSLPQIQLRVQGDTIQAIGIEGLIYGRHTNIL